MNNIIKKLIIGLLSVSFLLVISVTCILWVFSNELPDYKFLKNYKPSVSSKVYSGNGELVSDFSQEKRIFVPYDAIPRKLINAFLSSEDKNFFTHPGVDAKGVMRAILNNINNIINSKRLEGASTITQQVAKNFLLSNEVSLNRKIKEAILAFRIERVLSKERILELYMNQIYLGQGSYGVASASLVYFDKSISDLSYDEAALLAALPKAPSKYNPYKNEKLAKFRRNLVLKNLFDNGYIDKKTYENLITNKIKLQKRKKIYLEDTRYYVEDIRKNVLNKFGFDRVYKKGLIIKSPMNLYLQNKATEALRYGLEKYDRRRGWRGPIMNRNYNDWTKNLKEISLENSIGWKLAIVKKINKFETEIETIDNKIGFIKLKNISWTKKEFSKIFKIGDVIYVKNIKDNDYDLKQMPSVNGAVVVMNPYNGRVYAMSGGFSFKKSEFNRATQASRQPGSAFKPFIYALALENNYKPNSLILDAPIVLEQGTDLKLWKPENYGKKFYGPSTLRVGLEKSRNLMTVRIAQDIGIRKIADFSERLGIYKNPDELLSISLGSAETTLLKLTSAYCSFVNGGKKIKPILIDRIQDSEGNTIISNETRKCKNCDKISYLSNNIPEISTDNLEQIMSPQTAYQITSMLEGVIKRGTGKKLKNLNLDIAGKTGTTNKNTDTWFVGFTSKLVIGVYVGMDEPQPLGKYETGSRTAMPIFKEFIQKAVKKKDTRPFKVSENITMVMIDPKTGMKANFTSKETIIEAFKKDSIENNFQLKKDINDRFNKKNILQFY
ncbi:MAG: penicillin-binding protein 1A [Candidatus Pelagibacter sp.]